MGGYPSAPVPGPGHLPAAPLSPRPAYLPVIMLWFPLALLGAVSQATYSLAVKVLLRWFSPYSLAGFSFLAASLILFFVTLFSGIPPLGPGLLPALAVTVTINVAATILFYRALSTTDLSLSVPMLAFTPVFLILTSFLILGELPSPAGAAGIFLVAAGAFLLTKEPGDGRHSSLLSPFVTLRHDRGVQLMLFVAFLYSISVNYDKEVVINSSPLFGSALILLFLAVAFLLIEVTIGKRRTFPARGGEAPDTPDLSPLHNSPDTQGPSRMQSPPDTPSSSRFPYPVPLMYGAVGAMLALEGISINTAYTLSIVPYVITVKRLSIFFAVLFGGLLLHERHIRARMTGAIVMIAGAVVIGLWG